MSNTQAIVLDAKLVNGASLSAAVQCFDNCVAGLVCPSGLAGTVATFQVSYDGGTTFVNAYDGNGIEIQVTVAASRFVSINPTIFASVSQMKVRTGTAGSPTTQSADKLVQIVTRRA